MATRTISNSGGNYNDVGSWVEGAVPTNSDDVVSTATSGNLTINVNSVARSVDLTGYVGTLTHNAFNWTIGNATGGDLLLSSGMTYTKAASTSCKITLVSTAASANITTSGKTIHNLTFNSVGDACTYTLQDNLSVVSVILNTAGVLQGNGFNVSCGSLQFSTGETHLGSGTWTSGTINGGGINIFPDTSTVVLNPYGTISNLGMLWYNISFSVNGVISDDLQYSNSLTIASGSLIGISNGSTISLLGPSTVTANGVAFISLSGGSEFFIVGDGSSTYNFTNITLSDCWCSLGTFNAINSTDSGNNTGWNFIEGSTYVSLSCGNTLTIEDILRLVLFTNGTDFAVKIHKI
jgi:hypothetical protein